MTFSTFPKLWRYRLCKGDSLAIAPQLIVVRSKSSQHMQNVSPSSSDVVLENDAAKKKEGCRLCRWPRPERGTRPPNPSKDICLGQNYQLPILSVAEFSPSSPYRIAASGVLLARECNGWSYWLEPPSFLIGDASFWSLQLIFRKRCIYLYSTLFINRLYLHFELKVVLLGD